MTPAYPPLRARLVTDNRQGKVQKFAVEGFSQPFLWLWEGARNLDAAKGDTGMMVWQTRPDICAASCWYFVRDNKPDDSVTWGPAGGKGVPPGVAHKLTPTFQQLVRPGKGTK